MASTAVEIAELIENNEVHAGEIFGEAVLSAGAGFVLQPIDEVDDRVEAASRAAADASARNGNSQMRLASSRAADQHGVALLKQKATARQVADEAPDWQVIGLHHTGGEYVRKPNGQSGTYAANEAIWIQIHRRAGDRLAPWRSIRNRSMRKSASLGRSQQVAWAAGGDFCVVHTGL
jgi:hypothetical protein